MRIYVECGGYTARVNEDGGKWRVQPVVGPDGVCEEIAIGKLIDRTATSEKSFDSLIDLTGPSDSLYDSLEKAELAAHKQLEYFVGETVDTEWKEKC